MQERSTPRNRYPGVKPFNTEEREAFFGRERETEELFRLVYVKQVVVLYAKSGFGKSSLLNAGIIPKLLDDSAYHPLTIRFTNRSTQEADTGLHPIDTLKIRLQNELDISLPSPVSQLTNDDNSLWHWLKTWQNLHSNKGLILLFDQFEELFTYSPEAISTFSEELAEVLYSPIPLKYRRRLAELSKTKQLDVAFHDFLYQKPDLKIVFSVRTDRLALLNQLTDRHPAILQHCYELMPLRADQAEAALTQPAALPATDYDSPSFDYAPEAIQAILDSILKNGQVEATSVLQIVGRHTESKLVLAQGKTYITANDLGPVKDIIQNYYEDILQTLAPADRDNAQQLIEEKLISGQLRNPLSEAYIRQEFGISEALLKTLENSTLLRTERDAAGRLLYEISHDTLVEPIQQVAKERLAVKAVEKQKAMEVAIESEKQRNTKLKRLTQLAWGVSIIAILIALVAGYAWLVAEKAKAKWKHLLKSKEGRQNKVKNYEEQGELVDAEPFWFLFREFERKPLNVFVCYSHEDQTEMEVFTSALTKEFKSFEKQHGIKINPFTDLELRIGYLCHEVLEKNFKNTELLICLLSPKFFTSENIQEKEYGKMKQIAEQNLNKLIAPIYVKSCYISEDVEIANLQFWKPLATRFNLSKNRKGFSFSNLLHHNSGSYIQNYVTEFV